MQEDLKSASLEREAQSQRASAERQQLKRDISSLHRLTTNGTNSSNPFSTGGRSPEVIDVADDETSDGDSYESGKDGEVRLPDKKGRKNVRRKERDTQEIKRQLEKVQQDVTLRVTSVEEKLDEQGKSLKAITDLLMSLT